MMTTKSPISILQEMAQVQIIPLPVYMILSEGKEFRAILKLGKSEEIFSEAFGKTKQLAKELCAEKALKILKQERTNYAINENANLPTGFCGSLTGLFENHVGKLKEICDKNRVPDPVYIDCGTENGEYIFKCQLFDYTVTRGKARSKQDAKHRAAEAMIKVHSDRGKSWYHQPIKVREVEYQKTTDITFCNLAERIGESSFKRFDIHSCTKNENRSPKCEILLSPNQLSDNPVGKLKEICDKIMVSNPIYSECGTENGEFIMKCQLFDNTVTRGQGRTKKDAKRKAAEVMLKVYSDREKYKVTEVEYQKTTINLTFENPAQKVSENSSERFEIYLPCAKNANLTNDVNENISTKFYEILDYPSKLSEDNHVGRLNEICSKKMVAAPTYTPCEEVKGEFVIECRIFDNTVTKGQSKNKMYAKQNAAEAMLKLYSERSGEIKVSSTTHLENHIGRLNEICSQNYKLLPSYSESNSQNGEFIIECKVTDRTTRGQAKIKKYAKQKAAEAMLKIVGEKQFPKSTIIQCTTLSHLFDQNIESLPNELSSSATASCENDANKLNKICSQKNLSLPAFIDRVTENGEFVSTDCKIIQNTRGRSSISREGASQEPAEATIQTLTQSSELESQNKFVTIVEPRDEGLQKPMKELIPHSIVKRIDDSLLSDMNEEQLKFELRNLNIIYKISTFSKFKNAQMLKITSTKNCKLFVFIAIGTDTKRVHLDLLRKALFGMRILKTD